MKDKESIQSGIAEYYDKNTQRFLKNKKTKKYGSIHRKLFPYDVKSEDYASIYSNILLLEIIRKKNAADILDLGCGVGGTIRYLKENYSANYTGITLSSVQVKIAEKFNTMLELADFQDTSWFEKAGTFDLFYALESIQHNPDHNQLCRNLKLASKPGAAFIVIDDFLNCSMKLSKKGERLTGKFKKHWHAYGFTGCEDFITVCENNGFILIEKEDLSGYMKKTPVINFLAGILSSFLKVLPFSNPAFDNIIGGNSLKKLQQIGYAGYYKMVFEIR